jgi:hypothetical protein
MSAAQKGKVISEAHKLKLSLAHRGKPAPNKGVPMTEVAKQKLKAAKTGTKAPWRYVSLIRSDGVKFDSILEAALELGANRATIQKHLVGKLKTVHGFTFTRKSASLQRL